MENIFRISLLIAGIINILPSFITFLPDKIRDSYGIDIIDSNYELLLRHRAVLFAIVGGIMIYAAITKNNYSLALITGMVSMCSFILLYFLVDGPINEELRKIMLIDIAGIVILALGYACYLMK